MDFEKPIIDIEKRIEELKMLLGGDDLKASEELNKLTVRLQKKKREIFAHLTRWQIVQLARHPYRPYTMDYINRIFDEFIELHGDRLFRDDPAIVAGLARLNGSPVAVIGQQKGRETKEKIRRNFGMPNPEGYRKTLRVMKLAEKFNLPIISFIDTPGAFPGIGAEERGQAVAIATNLQEMSTLDVPIIGIIIGEGGSGGALGIAVTDVLYMLEYSIYSVISPEGCAAILYKDSSLANQAAEALKPTAQDLYDLKIIDGIIKEPLGGAHTEYNITAKRVKKTIVDILTQLRQFPYDKLVNLRYEKLKNIGVYIDD